MRLLPGRRPPERGEVPPARVHLGAPLGVQLAVLLLICLLVAQAMGILVVLLSRPPAPSFYSLSEVADAMRGGSLQTRLGRSLIRSTATAPPAEPQRWPFSQERGRRALAALLHVPEDRVRLVRPQPPLISELVSGRPPRPRPPMTGAFVPEPRGREGHGPGPGPGPGRDAEVFMGDGGGPGGPREFQLSLPRGAGARLMFGPDSEIFGDFIAAVRRPDGQWTVVRSAPEAFPNRWQRRIALWLLGCLLVVAPIGYLFVRRVTAPLDRFAKAAAALGRDPHAPPIPVSGPAEVGKAAGAINEMQARIRRYVDDRTAMVGAISHDLRTPLARIRYKLEQGPPELKQAVLSDVVQMEAMIGAVLAFIRDASEPRRRERIDLLSLVECVADDAAPLGEVEIVRAVPFTVEGDALALQRMLCNLVENAVKYGTRARIGMVAAGGDAVVEIEDDGPGLPAEELERVFTPFYRSSQARTLDVGGVGLGLAVARAIARAHGGDVELDAGPGGLTARVRLPLAQA